MTHIKYTKRHIVNIITKCIHIPNTLVGEARLDIFSINILWPVPPLLDGCVPIYPFFFISTKSCRTKKPQSNTTVIAVPWRFLVRCNIKDTFTPLYKYCLGRGAGVLLDNSYLQLTKHKIKYQSQSRQLYATYTWMTTFEVAQTWIPGRCIC